MARIAARFPVTAWNAKKKWDSSKPEAVKQTWKPDLMLATEHLEPQVSHCRKKSLVSFRRIVSGDRHVWHVTYSLIYRRKTFSICFCWKRPLMISWLFPSTDPLVPNSAKRKSNKCFGNRWSLGKNFISQEMNKHTRHSRFTKVGEISERRFLRADTNHLRWSHYKLLLFTRDHVWIFVPQNVKYSSQQLVIRVIPVRAEPRRARILR